MIKRTALRPNQMIDYAKIIEFFKISYVECGIKYGDENFEE